MSLLEDHLKWLNLHQEATLEPERPIVDPHHHFWPGEQHYLLEDLWLDTHSGHNIKKTVFIDPRKKTLKKIAKHTINLARHEGLEAHALSVEIRKIKP